MVYYTMLNLREILGRKLYLRIIKFKEEKKIMESIFFLTNVFEVKQAVLRSTYRGGKCFCIRNLIQELKTFFLMTSIFRSQRQNLTAALI